MSRYWDVLPTRLEEYEDKNRPTEEYLALKAEYTKVSLRAWIIANSNYERCETEVLPILYFYSKECNDCIMQGEMLDNLKGFLAERGKTMIAFTLDFDYDEPTLDLVKKYYNVTEVPAIVINGKLYQGRLFSENEILFGLNSSIPMEVNVSR